MRGFKAQTPQRFLLVVARLLVLLIAGSLAVRAGLSFLEVQQPPKFEDRSLEAWLDSGYEDASRALYEIGPAAVPGIFAKLRREHPQQGYWQHYRHFWQRLPGPCQKLLPRPKTASFDEWRASHALAAIGPSAVPAVSHALQDRNALVRSTAAQALAFFAEHGVKITTAYSALERAQRDKEPQVRQYAAQALRRSSYGRAPAQESNPDYHQCRKAPLQEQAARP